MEITKSATKIVYIRSKRGAFAKDGKPALKCHPNGDIQANTFGEAYKWETWKLQVQESSGTTLFVSLQSWTGKYLSAKPDGSVKADVDHIQSWELWEVINSPDSFFVALKSYHGKYLVCDDFSNCGKIVRADRSNINEWEEWAIVDDPNALTNPGHTAKCAIAGTLIAAGSILTMGALAVPLAGFGVGGVAAGSAAAAAQSAFYGGATCGIFSVLQSAGATLAWVPIAAGGAASAGTGAAVLAKKEEKDSKKMIYP